MCFFYKWGIFCCRLEWCAVSGFLCSQLTTRQMLRLLGRWIVTSCMFGAKSGGATVENVHHQVLPTCFVKSFMLLWVAPLYPWRYTKKIQPNPEFCKSVSIIHRGFSHGHVWLPEGIVSIHPWGHGANRKLELLSVTMDQWTVGTVLPGVWERAEHHLPVAGTARVPNGP